MAPLDRSGDGMGQVDPRARCARIPLQFRDGPPFRGRADRSLRVGDLEPGERPVRPGEGCPFRGPRIASSRALWRESAGVVLQAQRPIGQRPQGDDPFGAILPPGEPQQARIATGSKVDGIAHLEGVRAGGSRWARTFTNFLPC